MNKKQINEQNVESKIEEHIYSALTAIYQDINEWLKFAELKHGGITIFLGVILAAFIGAVEWKFASLKEYVILGLIAICFIPSLISQIPFLNTNADIKIRAWRYYHKKYPNLISNVFYISIFVQSNICDCSRFLCCSCGQYVASGSSQCEVKRNEFKRAYFNKIDSSYKLIEGSLIDDYLNQIIAVSEVAAIKYYLVNIAFYVIIGSVLMGGLVVLG